MVAVENMHAHGPLRERYRSSGWWGDHGVLHWWELAVKASPDSDVAVDFHEHRLTYAQADDASSRVASWLRSCGVKADDVVALQLPNWSQYVVALIAAYKVGAVVTSLGTNLGVAELAHALEVTECRVAFMATHLRNTDYRPRARELVRTTCLEHVAFIEENGFPSTVGPEISEICAHFEPLPASEWVRGGGDSIAVVLFTSGSEAEPKGVMLSHNNLIASEVAFSYALRLGPEDRMLMPSSMGHATGFMHGMIMPILTRGTAVLSEKTDGESLAMLVGRERVTCGMSVPTVVDALVTVFEKNGKSMESVRFLCCGGAPVPRTLLERSKDLGVRLYSVYGATESAPHTMTTFHDSDDRVVTTDGKACPGTEIRIVDPETRLPVPPGVEGEEASRGPAVFSGYLGRPDLTEKVVDKDGWYYSGDLAVMDSDGYIRITGRRKDLIIRGGENISAAEVERVLMDHPAIEQAGVVAMPDAVLGQKACAFLVARPGAARLTVGDLKNYFMALGIAKFKIPERVEYLDTMPVTGSGKCAKVELRKIIDERNLRGC